MNIIRVPSPKEGPKSIDLPVVTDRAAHSNSKTNLVSIETWRDAGPKVRTELEFKVTALDADAAGVLLIRGQLGRTRVQELLAISESSESRVSTDKSEPQDTESSTEPTQGSSDDAPRKKKKKKKDEIKEEETEGEIGIPDSQLLDSNTAPELNITTDEKTVVRKRRRKRKKTGTRSPKSF
ncbi:DNA-directed RNA polymerase I subunit RPA43-like [Nothobranchius furzeri]|uniref:DNA-directed RNA polymerase I subunit RPA43-like n=1 Tax=Nothobranchius furzeri TaxID=105023 RepID=UPI00390480A4